MKQQLREVLEHRRALLDEIVEKTARWESEYDAVLEAFEEAELEILRIDLDSSGLELHLSGNRHTLNRMFHVMRKQGFTPDNRPREKDTQFSSFFYNEDSCPVYVFFASNSCRRVQTGTRWVEEPVYETRCDDEDVPLEVPVVNHQENEDDRIPV